MYNTARGVGHFVSFQIAAVKKKNVPELDKNTRTLTECNLVKLHYKGFRDIVKKKITIRQNQIYLNLQ